MFEKYVAIDWSGAKSPRQNKTIQIAEYDPETRTVSPGAFSYPKRNWMESVE